MSEIVFNDHAISDNHTESPALADATLLQIQNRLFHLTAQLDQIQAQINHLAAESQLGGDQLDVLTRHFTDVGRTELLDQRLAELTTQLAAQEEQLNALQQGVMQSASRDQIEQLQQSVAQAAQREQIERLAQAVANGEQVERLLHLVANQQQVQGVEEALKKLSRTQFKTNTLGESKEQQIASALASLQEIATRRQQTQAEQPQRSAQQLEEARNAARTQFAAELLPTLDSLELALEHGETLLTRQEEQATAIQTAQAAYLRDLEGATAFPSQPTPAPTGGFWQRILGGAPTTAPAALPPPLPQPVPVATLQSVFHSSRTALSAWLRGLELVQERFVTLLAAEGIHAIDALHKPFDPRLHVAVEAETRSDAPTNTVTRVVRNGYRQQDRVLRYAEVVVARGRSSIRASGGERMSSDKIIGIDLGTTNSVLSVIQEGVPTLLPINGVRLLPSLVGVSPNGELLVGETAHNQWIVAPERTIRSIKRKMGSGETVTMADKPYTPQEISAFILRAIKEAAEGALGAPVQRAVITVPAYFNEVQRQATLEAGAIAGLTVERIINEPTASALAYGYGVGEDQNLRVLVYDLGGGTFDVSIIELNYGVVDVLATAGDNFLGGDDFDERLAAHIADEFAEEHDIDLREDHQAWARLLRAAEEAKIALSVAPYTTMSLEYIAQDEGGTPLHIRREVERQEFIELIDDLLQRTVVAVEQALTDAKLQPGAIDRVLLVGGSTRIPAVYDLVRQRMGQDPHLEIDPDAAVALGAAVQAGIIAGEEINAILVDVTPLSLGISSARMSMTGHLDADYFAPLIRRNSTIPVQKSELFTTLFPGQDAIHIQVFQGENPVASANVALGDFMVEELTPNRADGLAEVSVDFQIDVNGILKVTVTERATGKQKRERLKANRQRLSPEQIAASQARLAEIAERQPGEAVEEGLEFDAGVRALLDRAHRVLEGEAIKQELADQIQDALDDINAAAAEGDQETLQSYCDQLIDLLFEAEE